MTRRTERVAEEIREEVARMIATELKDPRIGFVTVTRVDLTPDLRLAKVFVGTLGAAQRGTTLAGLRQAAGWVRRTLGQRLRMRHVPEIQFQYDAGIEATERVAHLLQESTPPSPDLSPEGTVPEERRGPPEDD